MSLSTQVRNILQCFPVIWGSIPAEQPGGGFYNILAAIGLLHDLNDQQIQYVRLQTRLLTATDSNLEVLAADMLGPLFARGRFVSGTTFLNESDISYANRIQQQVIEPQVTLKGIQERVTQYLETYYLVDFVLNQRLMGLDTVGGLDTWGALDGIPVSVPQLPAVYVFDVQSNPTLAAVVGLTDYQFCIMFEYGGLAIQGFFVGRSYVGRNYLIDPSVHVISALTSDFAKYVSTIRALGTTPVYADNRV